MINTYLPVADSINIMSQSDVIPVADLTSQSDTTDHHPFESEAAMNQLNLSVSTPPPSDNNNGDADSVTSTTLQRSMSSSVQPPQHIDNVTMSLSTFLVQRASSSLTLANYFYWYLYIECEMQEETTRKQDIRTQNMYKNVLRNLKRTLDQGIEIGLMCCVLCAM